MTSHLAGLHGALKMLHSRVDVLLQYVAATQSGQLPVDHGLLRQIMVVVRQLPVLTSPAFQEAYLTVRLARSGCSVSASAL